MASPQRAVPRVVDSYRGGASTEAEAGRWGGTGRGVERRMGKKERRRTQSCGVEMAANLSESVL